uniref:Cilia- and flagella-associated protein 36 n=1 Tax=Globisporangium ultimum (strain ATCC 200006 / CBS 805.95 / DAOM BR144) TaxID=431595 RepID=K3XC66_GLOUD
MSELGFTSDESDWVFDYVMNIFRSPAWEVPIMCFIDENCASFDTGDENKFVYTDLHQQFRDVVEGVLGSSLAEIGITSSDFAEICERSRSVSDISMEVVNQILAMDDFLTFKKLMVKRNLELELEAIKALREEAIDAVDMDTSDMESHFMELSILYKQEEMEQAELESAIAMSIAVQEEQLRLASVASKSAEDKFDDSPERKDMAAGGALQLSPEEVHRQLHENKKKAEGIFKRSKESLEENKNKQKEWQQSAEFSDDEIKRREEYLRKQRDRIIEKKKQEREAQLKEFRQEQKETAPEPPAQLVEKVQNAVAPEELKKSEAEERRNALRIALARRMKQDLLESTTATEEPNFKFQQLAELDEKMQRVEELRRRSQEREQKVHVKLGRA